MTLQVGRDQLLTIFQTQYELRTHIELQTASDLFSQSLGPTCSTEKAKLLSFFATAPTEVQQQVLSGSIVVRIDQFDGKIICQKTEKTTVMNGDESQLLVVQGNDLLKCQALGWHSPQQEIRFLHSFLILSETPRKRLYSLLRQSTISKYIYGDVIFRQGEPMKSCYYFVREGQFSFCQRDPILKKDTQVLTFKTGYFLLHEAQKEDNFEAFVTRKITRHFDFTIKCKSSKGVLYCIEKEYFNSNFLMYCEDKLSQHLNNQRHFLVNNSEKKEHRRSYSQFSQKRRPQSQQVMLLTAPSISSARQLPPKLRDDKIPDLMERDTNYSNIKATMPKRNRLFSKAELRRLYPNPEQEESDSLIWKKSRCDKLREMTRPTTRPPTRGQILYDFSKITIRFEKNRKKPLLT